MFGPDDDEDFTPAANSKLAALFGQPIEEGNSSLTYTAPKQPKKSRPEPPVQTASPESSSKLSLIVVQAVQIYKLENGDYINQGRLGAALLGNTTTKLYQLLLYKNRQQHVTAVKITNKFQFIVQAKNFASFYDNRGQNWSIMFDSENEAINFAREVGVARACALTEKEEQSFYVQDLKVGDGTLAEMGDLLEIRYTTSLLVNGKLEKALETNVDADKPQRVKIRKGVWEEALLGATKGCKKFIILAPILFGPWKPLADPNNRLAVEVEIGRIKAYKRSRESTPVDILRHSESPESNVDSSTDETSIKARGASISEALTNSPKTNKASIISRMARMGQATLPLKGAIVCNPSDSEETEEESSGTAAKSSASPKLTVKTRTASSKRSTPSHTISPSQVSQEDIPAKVGSISSAAVGANLPTQQLSIFQQSPLAWHPPQLQQPQTHPSQYMINGVPFTAHSDGQIYATTQVVPVPAVVSTPSSTPETLSVYFSENRTHNSEVRMGLSKVVDKVDQVLDKLETLHQPSAGIMDPRTLLTSIQKLVVENEQLKVELADKRNKFEQQNEKMYQLLHQKFLEQSASSTSSWDQRQDPALQSVIIGLQQEKEKLASELAETVSKANAMQIQATNFERSTIERQEEVNKLTGLLQGAYIEIERGKQTILELENYLRSVKEKSDASVNFQGTQDSIINDLKTNVHDLEVSKSQLLTALEESKKQQELLATKLSEEKVLQIAHKDEVEKLKQNHEDLLSSFSKETLKCNDEDSQHQPQVKHLKEKVDNLEIEVASLKDQLKIAQSASIDDLKKVMNVMFKHLKSQFVPEKNYDGSDIREVILSTIQNITLEFVSMKTGNVPKTSGKENIEQPNETAQTLAVENPSTIAVERKSTDENERTSNVVVVSVDEPSEDKNEETIADGKKEDHIENTEVENSKDQGKVETVKVDESAVVLKEEENNSHLETKEESDELKQKLHDSEEKLGSTSLTEKSREHSMERGWRPQPPPPPLFDDEEDDDDWLS